MAYSTVSHNLEPSVTKTVSIVITVCQHVSLSLLSSELHVDATHDKPSEFALSPLRSRRLATHTKLWTSDTSVLSRNNLSRIGH